MKFEVKFLPARYGDCIWIEYGDQETHRILIDGGTSGTRENIKALLETLPEEERHFELMVVTHIDRDHIEGVLSLLEEDELLFSVGDFWFNGWEHLMLHADEDFGSKQGEFLSAAILKHELNWNNAFDQGAVVIPESGELPVIQLPGGMRITLLSPEIEHLQKLIPKWKAELEAAGLVPGFGLLQPVAPEDDEDNFGAVPDVDALNDEVFHEDDSAANGSSIAFLAEFDDKSVFFAGDCFPSVALNSLNKIYNGKAAIDLVKVSHHASAHNTSPELIEKIKSRKYVISTNGSRFHHPAAVTVSRIIKRAGSNLKLIFNYTSADNEVWDEAVLKQKHGYSTVYPDGDGVTVKL